MVRFSHLAAALLTSATVVGAQTLEDSLPKFSFEAPREKMTGTVNLTVNTEDPNVKSVSFFLDEMKHNSRSRNSPFHREIFIGPIPNPRRLCAVGYDGRQSPIYEHCTVLNPGHRAAFFDFITPLSGQYVEGEVPVQLQVHLPSYENVTNIEFQYGLAESYTKANLELIGQKEKQNPHKVQTYATSIWIDNQFTVLDATVKTDRRPPISDTIIVNNPPGRFSEAIDVNAAERLVSTRGEDVKKENFRVVDRKTGENYEVLEARLLKDIPFSFGIALDMSNSLRHGTMLRQTIAQQFIENIMKPTDAAFIYGFGDYIREFMPWTNDKQAIQEKLLSLGDSRSSITPIYRTLLDLVYEFQGEQGARAVIFISDGVELLDDKQEPSIPDGQKIGLPLFHEYRVPQKEVLEYLAKSGVTVHTIGIETHFQDGSRVQINSEGLKEIARVSGGNYYHLTLQVAEAK
jgi:hypothetical protein